MLIPYNFIQSKAICDKIITISGALLRRVKQTLELFIEDFRIDKQLLQELDSVAAVGWIKHRKKAALGYLLKY